LIGQSLGGAVLADLAAKDGARGLVLDRTFDSLPSVAKFHYPWLPVRMLMRSKLDAASVIGNYRGPLLQIHGDYDHIVPTYCGKRLFESANQPKELLIVPGLGHNDFPNEEVLSKLEDFVSQLPTNPEAENKTR
jgi:fermentation-respiration switch protein FrsA (DUF1100 family)